MLKSELDDISLENIGRKVTFRHIYQKLLFSWEKADISIIWIVVGKCAGWLHIPLNLRTPFFV